MTTACGGGGGGGGSDASSTPEPEPQHNRPPAFVGANDAETRAVVLHAFSYDVLEQGPFVTDPDDDPLTYTLTPSKGDWLQMSGPRMHGTPPEVDNYTIYLDVTDGRGGRLSTAIRITVDPNSPPELTSPNGPVLVAAGTNVNYDATKGGDTFTDPDGTPMTYELERLVPSDELDALGTRVVGSMSAIGAVSFRITATDAFGAAAEEVFLIAVASPEPGLPELPAIGYVYNDADLPLPRDFRESAEGITPLYDRTPPTNLTTDAGATLGRVLFYDKRLSITNTHACGSCHEQQLGFSSGRRFDTGVTGVLLSRNSMALTNVRYNRSNLYFSDERAESLEQLVPMPIENPDELGNSFALLEQKLAATTFYPPLFEAAFGTPEITGERIVKALAQFLRSLISYQSKHDKVRAALEPYTAEQLRGRDLFRSESIMQPRCSFCHITNVQTLAFASNNGLDAQFTDPGAGNGRFRSSSLRNIAVTGPYMHDGRFETLREVIDHYEHGIQPSEDLVASFLTPEGEVRTIELSDEQKDDLEAFLHALTDETFLSDQKFSDPFR